MKKLRSHGLLVLLIVTVLMVSIEFSRAQAPGTIVTVAGNGAINFSGDGGLAIEASLNHPMDVFVDNSGNLYIVDSNNDRIRKVDPSGLITTVAGGGNYSSLGDGGLATRASLGSPRGVFVDNSGNLYIADTGSQRIRKVDTNGIITTVAGGGNYSSLGDGGLATRASLGSPRGVFVDNSGNLYIADTNNNRIRKVDTNGIITTVAGGGSPSSSLGDGGLATEASLNWPMGIFVDSSGNLYIADSGSQRIRKVDPGGLITTIAGDGFFYPTANPLPSPGRFRGDGGLATEASLNWPMGIFVDGSGNLYIADTNNNRIRKVDTNGIITTVAGGGSPSSSLGDGGLATEASLNWPMGIFVDSSGNLYIADTDNHRIRKVIGVGLSSTKTIPADTSTLIFPLSDGTQAAVTFQSGVVTGHTVTFQSFGTEPPTEVPVVPPFDTPLFYFSLNTTIPDTVAFTARVALKYRDIQLADVGITDESSLTVAWFNEADSAWHSVQTTLDTAANRVVFETDHFSIWALASLISNPSTSSQGPPKTYTLSQNYPNPFNSQTTIWYALPQAGRVRLVIYNLKGQQVQVLVDAFQTAGHYSVIWDGRNSQGQWAASGVYLYRLTVGVFTQTRRMVLLQ